jgi:hypothetical protein
MNVTVVWDVIIHVLNNDTSQPYGFAINQYFGSGVALQPGKSCDLTFLASQTGTFSVYNTIFDTTDLFEPLNLTSTPNETVSIRDTLIGHIWVIAQSHSYQSFLLSSSRVEPQVSKYGHPRYSSC